MSDISKLNLSTEESMTVQDIVDKARAAMEKAQQTEQLPKDLENIISVTSAILDVHELARRIKN